ncbi:NAD(P)-dependent oxidoreductase [Streptomyces coeruleorubidus]|jgi:putative NADH-flavin reductase|uniref:NADH-flavin reductase n=1 Tax=Streptomyces africanus TaxID=231024 RepID=A0ABU0QRW0_9ACTN|nr:MULTISPECIES: NAD(P)-binding oxidoreductase [Streptomyces]MDQ0749142.1 putative NADH-flavin reductase [Streptomyces africanus]MDQ1018633.1 putative NADH-flavin reductase [Streptomyces afghaniensis]
MKLLILGATGPTGRHVVDLAVRSGDSVTAFVRNPAALGDLAERVTPVTGDATSHRDLAAAAAGHDAIVSALGRGNSVRADGLFTRASVAVIGAAGEVGVSRLVWLSSFGVGDTFGWSSSAQKLIYGTLLRSIYADKAIADESIRSSGLDWTLVYPTRLTHGPARGTYRADDRLPMKGNPTISRADVAAFMHRAAHGREWINRTAVISD